MTKEELCEKYMRRKVLLEKYLEDNPAVTREEAEKNRLHWIPRDWVETAIVHLYKAQVLNGIQQARLKLDIDKLNMRKYAEFVKECDIMVDNIQKARKAIAHRFTDMIDDPEKYCETGAMEEYNDNEMEDYFGRIKNNVRVDELGNFEQRRNDEQEEEKPFWEGIKIGKDIKVEMPYPYTTLQETIGEEVTNKLIKKEEENEERVMRKKGRLASRSAGRRKGGKARRRKI